MLEYLRREEVKATENMNKIALDYLRVPFSDLEQYRERHRGNSTMVIYECLVWWRNKHNDREKLYDLLKSAYEEGLIRKGAFECLKPDPTFSDLEED